MPKPKTIAAAERQQRSGEARENARRIRELDRQIATVKKRAKAEIAAVQRLATKETRGLLVERRALQKRNHIVEGRLAA